MTRLPVRMLAVLAVLTPTSSVWAQTPDKSTAKPGASAKAATAKPKPAKASAALGGPAASEPDIAFGAFQRGHYLTAFAEATRRVEEKADPKAMTLLGELYANGFGVGADDKKAADWYRLAAARGDREAMFALALFRISGR